jgi:hypothetical protein
MFQQLRERGERLLAVDYANRQSIWIGILRGRERKREEGVLVVFFEHDDGTRELAVLAVELIAHVLAEPHPPDLTFTIEEPRNFVGSVGCFLDCVPAVEVILHTRASRASYHEVLSIRARARTVRRRAGHVLAAGQRMPLVRLPAALRGCRPRVWVSSGTCNKSNHAHEQHLARVERAWAR